MQKCFFISVRLLLAALSIFVLTTSATYINGREANLDQAKHQVSIRLRKYENIFGSGHICGGTLISPNAVLTAAHCLYQLQSGQVRSENEFIVVAGTLNRFRRVDNTLVYDVKSLKIPETFYLPTLKDDIAILYLDGKVAADQLIVQPISLNEENVLASTQCQLTGWGITQNYSLSVELHSLNVEIVDHDLCTKRYGSWLQNGMLCATYMKGEMNACQGDSGNPLVCNGQLFGIFSWGNECARSAYPGVYTDVAFYRDWINLAIGGSGRITSSFIVLALSFVIIYFY